MNRKEHLIAILAEEAVEVVQDCMKSLRFGLDDNYLKEVNQQRLKIELSQLYAMVEMLMEEGVDLELDMVAMAKKKVKVEEFLEYSKAVGTLS